MATRSSGPSMLKVSVVSMSWRTSVSPSLRKSLAGCVVLLQMSSKSGSRKQPAPMPNGYVKLRLPHVLEQPASEAVEGMVPLLDPCDAADTSRSRAASSSASRARRPIMAPSTKQQLTGD